MEKKAHIKVCGFQIIEELAFRRWVNCVRGLHLYYDLLIDHHVEAVCSDVVATIGDFDGLFPSHGVSTLRELYLHGVQIELLEKSESKGVVNFKEDANDGLTKFLVYEISFSHEKKMQLASDVHLIEFTLT